MYTPAKLPPKHAQSEQEISSKIFNDHEHTQNSTEPDPRYGRRAVRYVGVRGGESESVSDVHNKSSKGEELRVSARFHFQRSSFKILQNSCILCRPRAIMPYLRSLRHFRAL